MLDAEDMKIDETQSVISVSSLSDETASHRVEEFHSEKPD